MAETEVGAPRPIMSNYSPNLRWGKQVLEVTLKQWRYQQRYIVRVGGNCLGFEIFETALDNLLEQLDEANPAVALVAPNGDECRCEFVDSGERWPSSWLGKMVVEIRIVDWEPPTQNEIRKMNGAGPLPDGDRPWDPDGSFTGTAREGREVGKVDTI